MYQVVIWNEEKYGWYTCYNVKNNYDNKNFMVNFEYENNFIPTYIVKDDIVYEVYSSLFNKDTNKIMLFVYKM